jgi:hypothetical protein
MGSEILRRQYEEQRLRHAIEYIEEATKGAKKITTSELARLNRIIIVADDTAWRTEPVTINIPTGKTHRFSLISNPVEDARRILGHAYDLAYNGEIREAAIYLYLQLVEEHLFQDANRRTAALAAKWILSEHDYQLDVFKLLEIPLGDVRDGAEKKSLTKKIGALIGGSK